MAARPMLLRNGFDLPYHGSRAKRRASRCLCSSRWTVEGEGIQDGGAGLKVGGLGKVLAMGMIRAATASSPPLAQVCCWRCSTAIKSSYRTIHAVRRLGASLL
jgi:hypothetical protein